MNAKPATDKQVALIGRLASERDTLPLSGFDSETLHLLGDGDLVPARDASRLIEALFACPRREAAPAAPAAEPGYYVQGDDVLVVVKNREGTRTYAKRLVVEATAAGRRARWEYAPGVGRTLAGYAPLTAEEAARLGHLHGVCVVCAKALTDPVSVERGIGPVCVRRLAA